MTDAVAVLAPSPSDRRRRSTWLLVAAAAVLFAAGVPATVWFVHWRSSEHSLVDYPTFGVGGPLGVGKSEYVGENARDARLLSRSADTGGHLSLRVISVRPIVGKNTAAADVVVLRCVLAQDGPPPLGSMPADVSSTCATLTRLHPGPLRLGFRKGDDDVVVEVTPRHPGSVRISGLDLRYSSGLRHGTQHIGAQINFTARS